MALERDLHYKLAFLENKIAEKKVETKEPITNPNLEEFRLMFSRIEDKLENYVSVKVREINSDVYLERRNTTQLSAEELKNYLEEIMASPFQKLESLNALHDILLTHDSFGNSLNQTLVLLSSIDKNISQLHTVSEQTEQFVLNNLTEKIESLSSSSHALNNNVQNSLNSMHDKLLAGTGQIEDELKDLNKKLVALSKNKDRFITEVQNSLALLQTNLLAKSKELQSSMNSSIRSISDNLTQIKVSTKQKTKSAIAEAFAFRTCERGMTNLMNTTTEPYMILPLRDNAAITTPYLCDVVTDGGGWTIIQRRSKGDLDFYRDWAAYRQGFGSLDGDFWLGNENIHAITSRGSYELRVDLKYEGKLAHAHYRSFSIDNESKNYALRLGGFLGGEAGDSFEYHKDSDFSTYDQDNDSSSKHCAKDRYGDWWYVNCANVNLNGKWQEENKKGLEWFKLTGGNSVEYSEMKIRPV